MKPSPQWLVAISTLVIPFLLLLPLGILWLWEQGLLLGWLIMSIGCAILGWGWSHYLRNHSLFTPSQTIDPDPYWTDTGYVIWQKVEAFAETVTIEDYPFNEREKLIDLGKYVLKMVADHYHPQSSNSLLEIPVPYLLKIIELVSADLRTNFITQVPGSHMMTINSIIRGQQLATTASKYYDWYRMVSLPLNPVSALLREIKDLLSKQLFNAAADSIKLWLLQTYVKKVGYYGIELYSGQKVLDETALEAHVTDYSQQDLQQVQDSVVSEPLRFLVLGQVKAGKSSFINAMLGEAKATVDVLPQTQQLTPYLMNRIGVDQAILCDSVGYAGGQASIQFCQQIAPAILNSDFIFLVCAANTAARQSDKQVLTEINRLFQSHLDIAKPPLLVILTHIDQLRPLRVWRPPYNILNPENLKAQSIRQAMETVATALALDISQIIPVSVKSETSPYNVEEGVLPTLLMRLDQAKRLRYLRCMQSYKKVEYWQQLWTQTHQAGTVMIDAASKLLNKLE